MTDYAVCSGGPQDAQPLTPVNPRVPIRRLLVNVTTSQGKQEIEIHQAKRQPPAVSRRTYLRPTLVKGAELAAISADKVSNF